MAKRVIRFKGKCAPYNGGESAGFSEDVARHYVTIGVAEYVVTDVPAAPIIKAEASAPAAAHVEHDDDAWPSPSSSTSEEDTRPRGLSKRRATKKKP